MANKTIKVSDVIYREDLYPRIKADPATIQKYADNLEVLPPIEINQNNELIDGYHRWTAHRKAEAETIAAIVTRTSSDVELLALACQRNAAHGLQLNNDDKRKMAIRLYAAGTGMEKNAIADALSVTLRSVTNYLSNIDKQLREERKQKIFDMWLSCHTQEEIAEAVNVTPKTVDNELEVLVNLEKFPKLQKLSALHQDDFDPELYDIWNFAKKTNETKHYGNTEVRIVDNLLYTFTQPFDIVVDPFGGGGSTIDICKKRMRRYWVSDRIPPVERPDIRPHDVVADGISGPPRWADVSLVYLDPPYWKQAAGKYSKDKTDLANMSLEEFTKTLIGVVHGYASKLKPGSHIACIISPTQWPNQDKSVNYHDIDLACGVNKKLKLVRRALCPYSSEQYNGTQVNIAKRDKLWMVLSRTVLVWERQ
jgi:DNA modification methylase